MGNKDDIRIELAVPSDCIRLTAIAFAAKRHWNYPEEYFDIWRNELTITKDYIDKNLVFVAICDEEVIGFGAIVVVESAFLAGEVFVEEGYWLDHLFIDPCFLYQGIGTKLIDYATKFCSKKGVSKLLIFTDPHAVAFYEKSGAVFLYDSLTSIRERKIPVYCLSL